MRVLITGGAGYIGSTIASACLDAGHDVVIVDDLSEGRPEFAAGRPFYSGDIADSTLMDRVFTEQAIDVVVHCAAAIVVPESVSKPLYYYENNVGKTLDLLATMERHGVRRLVFSSSASLYSPPEGQLAATEDSPVDPGSPYARTKLVMEMALQDVSYGSDLRAVALRYFNPIGADPQLRSGQQRKHPSHVLAKMLEAWSEGGTFTITGCDWDTPDGTGIRDYLHIWDLAKAHVAAIEKFDAVTATEPYRVINIGRGEGVSVRQLAEAFQTATGEPLKIAEGPSRPGDVLGAYAVVDAAHRDLGWTAELTVADGIRDAIAWLPKRQELLGY
ncbi:MAG: UDP-glucose 4-epimerase GalE [Propionibacteriaceae bacterium]